MPFTPGQSGNPSGRPKLHVAGPGSARMRHSATTVKGSLERFIKRNYTARKLQKLFDAMTERQRLELYLAALPYLVVKPQVDSLSDDQINQAFEMVQSKLNNGKVANGHGGY